VIWQSPPFTDYVWAARAQLSVPLRQALIDAFLDLDLGSEADRPSLEAEGTSGFVPAFPSDFDEVSEVLLSQGRM
jgi:ABC-type phosphate/phosphonate transport system substrate-binding protein